MWTKIKPGIVIQKKYWWKFWKIDRLIIILDKDFHDPYFALCRQNTWNFQMKDYVIEEIRAILTLRIKNIPDLIKKSSEVYTEFNTGNYIKQKVKHRIFVIEGRVYFDFEKNIKRENTLIKIGIK